MNGLYSIRVSVRFVHELPSEPVTSSDSPSAAPAIGRPRSERARLATLEAVAARAGVSKVTIYKWWSSRGAVAVDAYFHRFDETYTYVDTGDVAADLTTQIRLLLESFRGRAGEIMAELIGRAQSDPSLAETLRTGWLVPRRLATATVLQRAVDRSQLRPDIDIPTVMDQLYAPLYWRLMMGHQALDDGLAGELVRNILEGAAVRHT